MLLVVLVSAWIQCQFDYVWSLFRLTQRSKSYLQICQNNEIRFMLVLPPRTHIGASEFKKFISYQLNIEWNNSNRAKCTMQNIEMPIWRSNSRMPYGIITPETAITLVYVPGSIGLEKGLSATLGSNLPPEIGQTQSKSCFRKS